MKKENLFQRWLDHDLSEDDRALLKDDERFGAYEKFTQAAQYFRAPEFDASSSYDRLRIKQENYQRRSGFKVWRIASGIAAILVLGFLVVNLLANQPSTFTAAATEKVEISLPDNSKVNLNAGSYISFNEDNWQDARTLELSGEALFSVAKGSKFTVETEMGQVSVLGTVFNVVQRQGLFEVTCYEGRVLVEIPGQESKELTAGEGIKLLEKKLTDFKTATANPSWVNDKSVFKSTPYHMIIGELERQYGVTIDATAIDKNVIFTGSFTHQDLETALKAVTLPLDLSYQIEGSEVKLVK